MEYQCYPLALYCKWLILGRTGLIWTYRRPYARTRWHLRGSGSLPLGSEAWPLNHCAGADVVLLINDTIIFQSQHITFHIYVITVMNLDTGKYINISDR